MGRFNEYYGGRTPTAKQTGALGIRKFKNDVAKLDPTLVVTGKGITLNGAPKGCSGFISTADGSKHVYFHAEVGGYSGTDAYYRTAEHTKDYRGGTNRFVEQGELAEAAVQLLQAQ